LISLAIFLSSPFGAFNFFPAFAGGRTIPATSARGNPMDRLAKEIDDYRHEKEKVSAEAGQRAALFLTCGIDLSEAFSASGADRDRIVARLQRLIERERIKGGRRHWSYDLNRHIALKQALDRLREGAA
jgi:hypothetical protein